MGKIKKIIILTLFSFLIAGQISAALVTSDKLGDFNNNINTVATAGEYKTTLGLEGIIGTIVKMLLSILGVIFVLLMFMAGNDWAQAAGNEEKVKKSKETIRNLIIGLALVLIAYALSAGFSKLVSSVLLTK